MKQLSFFTLVFSIGMTMAGSTLAGTLVLGEDLAASCYHEAKWGNTDRDAITVCDRALSEQSMGRHNRAATYVNRGIVRAARGDLAGAIEDYNRALKIKPLLGEALANKGAALIHQKHYAFALDSLNEALKLKLTRPANVYFNRAVAREETGDVQGAYEDFQKAATLEPNWSWPKRELKRFSVVPSS